MRNFCTTRSNRYWPRRTFKSSRVDWDSIRLHRHIRHLCTWTSAAPRHAGRDDMRVRLIAIVLLSLLLFVPTRAAAYSVLAHEANIDALWDGAIRPLLARRFPRATRAELQAARAYAYGG